MGAALSSVHDAINKADDLKGKQDEVNEALTNMIQMANDHLTLFNERIRNDQHDTHLIPIDQIVTHYEYVQCVTSQEDTIGPAIQQAVKDFSSGSVADGIAKTAGNMITKLLGQESGSRQIQTQYLISVDPLGGISRLDTTYFVYTFKAEGFKKVVGSVVASCVVKSSAKTEAMSENTLKVLVNQCFDSVDVEKRKEIYHELVEEFRKLKKKHDD
ncbi:hypothetical protein OPQ81_002447 [Rhizoctonia solani]|nr:hypothetical protein OPQ81_002447 [Rhizoctonia solani]